VLNEDFYDKSHLNYKGAEKFTRFFAKDIVKRFGLEEVKADDKEWNGCLEKYYEHVAAIK